MTLQIRSILAALLAALCGVIAVLYGGTGMAAAHDPRQLPDLVERLIKSAVSIQVTSGKAADKIAEKTSTPPPSVPSDHPFAEFFKNLKTDAGQPRSLASGLVYSSDGHIITANHVVDGATAIEVTFSDGSKSPARLVGADPRSDLALLRVTTDRILTPVTIGQAAPRLATPIVVVSNAYGMDFSVSTGIISNLNRNIGDGPYSVLQVDAMVSRGGSGAPVFDLAGDLVGMASAIYSPTSGFAGIAFAIPADRVRHVAEQLRKSGAVERGWLGVKIQDVDEQLRSKLGTTGVLVNEVTPDGPAERGGLLAADVVVKLDGVALKTSRELAQRVADIPPGAKVVLFVMRGGAERTIIVTLGRFPAASGPSPTPTTAPVAPPARPTEPNAAPAGRDKTR